jgi:hypothetical protein
MDENPTPDGCMDVSKVPRYPLSKGLASDGIGTLGADGTHRKWCKAPRVLQRFHACFRAWTFNEAEIRSAVSGFIIAISVDEAGPGGRLL